ncbi:hypothetical protein JZ751_001492 [Albula glossodonta]|uniref:Uncharacterized protein n=1 Tax=Albula glossodonta TaxID=121402 RepID=A0A8T2PTW1_9TELE|nr:hypothetical protein JZ751_001492 [Albula glossodonta]
MLDSELPLLLRESLSLWDMTEGTVPFSTGLPAHGRDSCPEHHTWMTTIDNSQAQGKMRLIITNHIS